MENEEEVREGVVEHYKYLFKTASYLCKFDKDEANDLTQQTVIQALTHAQQFKEGTNVRAWLVTIMHNIFVNAVKKNARVQFEFFDLGSFNKEIDKPVDRLSQKETLDAVMKSVSGVPEEQVRPLLLYSEGFKYEEISAMMKLPLGTVKSRINIVRTRLKEEFNQIEY